MNHKPYVTSLTLYREGLTLTAGLCLARSTLEYLNFIQDQYLHPEEQSYFETLQHTKRQHSYLLGRYCAKHALTAFLPVENLKEIVITNGIFQQPLIYYPAYHHLEKNNIQVSISHTATLGAALVFLEAHPMSIDVENLDNSKNEVIRGQLTANEQTFVEHYSNQFGTNMMQILWTAKEALSKVIKCGLMVPFEILEIEKIESKENYFISHFKNFYQYKALSFQINQEICSLVIPEKTTLRLDILSLVHSLSKA